MFQTPLVRLKRASVPSAVFPPGYPPSGGGITACATGMSARPIIASVMMESDRMLVFMDAKCGRNFAVLSMIASNLQCLLPGKAAYVPRL